MLLALSLVEPETLGMVIFGFLYAAYLEWRRHRSDRRAAQAVDAAKEAVDTAKGQAEKTAKVISETKDAINGRMDDLLKECREKSYADGYAAGVATTSRAVAQSPQVSLDAKGVAAAVASVVVPEQSAPDDDKERQARHAKRNADNLAMLQAVVAESTLAPPKRA